MRDDQRPRFAANYARGQDGAAALLDDPATSIFLSPRGCRRAAAAWSATGADYLRFCRFLLGRGELDGVRLLGAQDGRADDGEPPATATWRRWGRSRFSESSYAGIGFGLGFSVMLDPARAQIVGTPGECAWGGAASTAFWVDPAEDLAVVFLTQLTPSSTYPVRRELRVLVYSALVD